MASLACEGLSNILRLHVVFVVTKNSASLWVGWGCDIGFYPISTAGENTRAASGGFIIPSTPPSASYTNSVPAYDRYRCCNLALVCCKSLLDAPVDVLDTLLL